MGRLDQSLEIFVGAIIPFDRIIIGYVVSVIAWGLHHRHQPNAGDSKVVVCIRIAVVQIIQMFDQSLQIADAVSGQRTGNGVRERANKHLVEYRLGPPGKIFII